MNTINTSRLVTTFCLFLAGYLVIAYQLYTIQIKQHTFFANRAKQQYNTTITLKSPRALIFDRHNKPVVLNETRWAAFIIPKLLKNRKKMLTFLRTRFKTSYHRLIAEPQGSFIFLQRNLCANEKQHLESEGLDDIHFAKEESRFYPPLCMSHITGLTDIDNNGIYGIEQITNTQLKGPSIPISVERDARSGDYYFERQATEKVSAQPITLTLDSSLQLISSECLSDTIKKYTAQEGMAIIMNPVNGHILAAVQYPYCNPNDRAHLNMADLQFKPATHSYEFGSVMKVFVALAALDEKVVSPDEIIDCESSKTTTLNGLRVNTCKASGKINFSQVVELSNNIGMVKISQRIGKKLYDHYRKLGFGTITSLNWPGEQKGFITPPDKWSKRSIISLSFGYEIAATLIQLAQAYCVIANNGEYVSPSILLNSTPEKKQLYPPQIVKDIKQILEKTVLRGTARKARIPGYRIMGKTGTANLLINKQYDPDHNLYTFAGIIEQGDYKRVIVTCIKDAAQKNLYASQVATPLFERLAQQVIIHDKVIY